MSTEFIVTNAGRAALVNAANDGTNAVTLHSCGLSALNSAVSATTTNLPGQFKTIDNISGGAVDDDVINLSFADQSNDAYDVRSMAIYLQDGTLFAVYSQANPIATKVANGDVVLGANIKFLGVTSGQINFGNINLFNPPATETKYGVVKRATAAEVLAGVEATKYVTPKTLKDNSFWNAANDGAGSTLDADMLDGQHGSFYLDCGNHTGTLSDGRLPATMSAKTFTAAPNVNGNTIWHAGNDGSGSGMDADLLDGQHGSFYLDCGNFTGTLSDGRLPATMSAKTFTAAPNVAGNTVWHAGNDGSGSGLDADLLDGYNSSEFIKKSGDIVPGTLDFSTGNQFFNNAAASQSIYFNKTYLFEKSILFQTAANRYTYYYANAIIVGLFDTTNGGVFNYSLSGNLFTHDCPVNFASTVTVAQNTIWHAGNDGSGSGMDADLLDGQHGSYFLDCGNFTGTLSDGRLPATISAKTFTAAPNVAGNTVWHAGNDGSGSGLDADLLDGHHGSYYDKIPAFVVFDGTNRNIIASKNVASIDYITTGVFDVNFTNPMPSAGYGIIGNCDGNSDTDAAVYYARIGSVRTTTKARIVTGWVNYGGSGLQNRPYTSVIFIQ